jgi:hypothetical protein
MTVGHTQAPISPVLPFLSSLEGHGARPPQPPPPAVKPPPPSVRPPPPSVKPTPPAAVAEPLNVLSLAQYASLCAELTVFPEHMEETFRRYGLDTGEKRSAIDAAWKERLRLEPAEYAAWQDLYRRYHAHWTKQGTPPQDEPQSSHGPTHPRRA